MHSKEPCACHFGWTGRCCPYPLVRWCSCWWLGTVSFTINLSFLQLQAPSIPFTFPVSGVVLLQHCLIRGVGLYCGPAFHDRRYSYRTSTVVQLDHKHKGKSCYPPLVLTVGFVREELPIYYGRCLRETVLRLVLCILSRVR